MKKLNENEEENLRPLSGENENSFSVPAGYFEELPETIMNSINALPDFEKASSVNPFSVPDNYFEKLPVIISDRISDRKSKTSSLLIQIFRPRFVIPAAFATLIFLAGLYFYKQKNIVTPDQQELTVDDLPNSSYLQSIDEDLLVDILADQKDVISVDSIEQYLIDNNVETSQIEKKL